MKKKLKIKSYCPPIVANILDKSYLIYNNGTSIQWVDVPYNYDWTTEFEYKELNPKITSSIVYKKTIKVKSSNKKDEYILNYIKFKDGVKTYDCSCPGAMYRGKCKHITKFKNQINNIK